MPALRLALGLAGVLLLTASLPAQNIMRIGDVTTSPGAPFSTAIFLTHDDPVQGFQTAMTFDSGILTLVDMTTVATDVEALLLPNTIEFFLTTIDNAILPGIGWGATAAVFDTSPPFDSQTLPAGVDQSLVFYDFTTLDDQGLLGSCTLLELTNGFGPPPGVNNIITVNATSVIPQLLPGQACFVDLPVFIRGDINQDDTINLADSIYALQYLFYGGPQPACLDAGDFNDDESLDISDIVASLFWQFQNGPQPPEPYPSCGVDATGAGEIGCFLFPQCGTLNPPPVLVSLSPTSGSAAGGDTVTLVGSDFAINSLVYFGGEEAPSVIFISETELQVVTPPHPPGTVSVAVTTSGGGSTLTDAFTYN